MKKTTFLILLFFFFFIILSPPKDAKALVYEVTVTVNSIKVPERGSMMGGGGAYTNAEFRIGRNNYCVGLRVKDPIGAIVGSNYNPCVMWLGAGDSFTVVFPHLGGVYSINFSWTPDFSTDPPLANCTSAIGDFRIVYLQYFKSSGWEYATCPVGSPKQYYYSIKVDASTPQYFDFQVGQI